MTVQGGLVKIFHDKFYLTQSFTFKEELIYASKQTVNQFLTVSLPK